MGGNFGGKLGTVLKGAFYLLFRQALKEKELERTVISTEPTDQACIKKIIFYIPSSLSSLPRKSDNQLVGRIQGFKNKKYGFNIPSPEKLIITFFNVMRP